MVKWQKVSWTIAGLLQEGIRTTHNRIVLAGLLIGLCYFPVWAGGLLVRAAQGSAGLPLIAAAVFLGFQQLWQHRQQIAQLKASEEDKLLGHTLIISGVVLFPFCRFEIWSQAVLWLLILVGIACSSWGVSFFRKYLLATVLMTLSVYPKPGVTAKLVWQMLTPPEFLEQIMANWGAAALRIIGYQASVAGTIVSLPEGGVDVDWGCNGFNMAFTIAAAGLILGLFLRLSTFRIVGVIIIGVILALIFNVPRIVLLTIASVYWGEDSFKFWHGPWGGQMFSGILLTVYYYIVMWVANYKRSNRAW
jgi:exosortase/archaeosortase family protein